jgi:hypothetical protein
MYAKGMSTRDIEDHLRDIYGVDVSPGLISRITDKIMPAMAQWQSRLRIRTRSGQSSHHIRPPSACDLASGLTPQK